MEKYLGDLPGLRVEIFSYNPALEQSIKKRKRKKKTVAIKPSRQEQLTLAHYDKNP
jgi:hypothetical protein